MKHKAFRWIPAVLLAALLAGCGAKTAASARPAGSRELKSTPPDSMHATAAITEQYTLEKVVQAENGGTIRLNIHLPRLESDSADAARINAIGQELETEFGVKHLPSDFKKHNGYLRSLQLSEQYGLYRQDYCGCEFSARARGIV